MVENHSEEWRPVVGWEGLYAVSNMGRVMRVCGGTRNTRAGRILKPQPTHDGYLNVSLHRGGGVFGRLYVARMVAFAFLPRKAGRDQVNHIDGVKTNNTTSNLEWVNASENSRHSCTVLGRGRGATHYRARLNEHQARIVIAMSRASQYRGWQAELARVFGVSQDTINHIAGGTSWTHLQNGAA